MVLELSKLLTLFCLPFHHTVRLTRNYHFINHSANVIAIAPEFLGHEEFVSGKYWPDEIYIDETKKCYELIGFTKYNRLSG